MKWNVYKSLRDSLARDMASVLPKKDRGRSGIADLAVRGALTMVGNVVSTIDLEALQSETDWIDLQAPTYFPESPEMLEMLWRAKMDVRTEDLELDKFPRAFSIAWPDCEIAGQRLKGCLIWWGSVEDRRVLIDKFDKRIFGKTGVTQYVPQAGDNSKSMHVYYMDNDDASPTKEALFRVKVEGDRLTEWLSSKEEFEKRGREFGSTPLIFNLTQGESDRTFVMSRLAVRLMAYMRACPGKVKEGYPTGRGAREFNTRWTEPKPIFVGQPAGMLGGHGSPCAHWRTWHLRSYPIKRDGTKKAGLVFVDGTVVGLELDPATVSV